MIPSDPAVSLRASFREWILPDVFCSALRSCNLTDSGKPWLTDRQLWRPMGNKDHGEGFARTLTRRILKSCRSDRLDLEKQLAKTARLRERKEWLRKNGAGLDV